MHCPYVDSGPYCYANSFAMMFGATAQSTAVIEFATSSPFGMQVLPGGLPFFDPYGWTPEASFEAALAVLGWRLWRESGSSAGEALARLEAALSEEPAWGGPLEIGHLVHQPGMTGPIGADHYAVELEVAEERVLMHDPQGYLYASPPLADFIAAWRAERGDYGEPYTMRTRFVLERAVDEVAAIREAIPQGRHWLSMTGALQVAPGQPRQW
ncbi:hypothetical protein [Labrys sp. 22185]|uniref:hypothetical protein n=1 Tax=Labrys sp. 22185 TaxID=3453888 RepID=UPI003F848CE5